MNKIDFAVVLNVDGANPNGDPLMGNRPRQDLDGYGEMTDVSIKRKIRNRLQDMEQNILMQDNGRSDDGFKSIKSRIDSCSDLKKAISKKDASLSYQLACKKWIDARLFGSVFAFKGVSSSIGIRGAVSITHARSISPIFIEEQMITKSLNTDDTPDGRRDSTTMAYKYTVNRSAYVFYGSVWPQLAEKNGVTDADIELLKEALISLFDSDASSTRPGGSMNVGHVFWWEHNGKQGNYPSGKVFRSLKLEPKREYPYYSYSIEELPNISPEIIEVC